MRPLTSKNANAILQPIVRRKNRVRAAFLFILTGSALLLTSCGKPQAHKLNAPENIDKVLYEFIEICSPAMTSVDTGVDLAKKFGWEVDEDGIVLQSNDAPVHSFNKTIEDSEFTLNIISMNFPHAIDNVCLLINTDGAQLNISDLNKISNMQGETFSTAQGQGGFWSTKSGGAVVTIHHNQSAYFLMLTMNRRQNK